MHKGPVILVVDDEALIRIMIADVLRDDGYHVLEASSGDEALLVYQDAHHLDLVVSDVLMPGSVDGLALAFQIKDMTPDIPVLLVTASPHVVPEGVADGVVTKPFRMSEVQAKVGQLIGFPSITQQ